MSLATYFPVWNQLTEAEQRLLEEQAVLRSFPKGTVLHDGSADCMGLLLLRSGQLRAYILSDEGREVTIYRLLERDICLISASCIMNSIQFDITITTERDTEAWVIPPDLFRDLMEQSAPLANYTREVMGTRLSDVMWLIEQILWKSIDRRLADFLITESRLEESPVLPLTHEAIANHLGTAREVVTRMLRYFQNEGMVKLSRGAVEIINAAKLEALIDA